MNRRTFLQSTSVLMSLSAEAAAPQPRSFVLYDVFTDRPMTGNPLPVFWDATGLTGEQMLAVAREMNHSESTFLFPAESDAAACIYRTRIFTKDGELPFAGHPVLGTAFALWEQRGRKDPSITLRLSAGDVAVRFQVGVNGAAAIGTMVQPEPEFRETHAPAAVAPLIGLAEGDIDPSIPIQTVSTGRARILVLLKSRETLQRVQMNWPAIRSYVGAGDAARSLYLLCRADHAAGIDFYARYLLTWGEDPVTGSAGGPAIAWLVRHGLVQPGALCTLSQGTEVHRPGLMLTRAQRTGDHVTQVEVGGSSVKVGDGSILI